MDFVIYFIPLMFYPMPGEGRIRCFDCTFDMKNEHCDDRFNTIGIKVVNCTGSCVKVKMFDGDEEKVYGRYCSPTREEEKCRVTDAGGEQSMAECYCNKDLCNAAIRTVHGFQEVLVIITAICAVYLLVPLFFTDN